jgi:hypothetical protein
VYQGTGWTTILRAFAVAVPYALATLTTVVVLALYVALN